MRNTLRFKIASFVIATAVVGGSLLAVAGGEKEAPGKERGTQGADLPAAVLATVNATAPGATISKAELEEEDGATVYEVKVMTSDGRKLEIMVSPDGTLVETEEYIAGVETLPAAVTSVLQDLLPAGKTTGIEKATVVVYEIRRQVGDRTYEIEVGADGSLRSVEPVDTDED